MHVADLLITIVMEYPAICLPITNIFSLVDADSPRPLLGEAASFLRLRLPDALPMSIRFLSRHLSTFDHVTMCNVACSTVSPEASHNLLSPSPP